ncbi:MAG: PQQ-binding-like beta-propeller repeat protein [Saprospiraceae bacterium]|nr:PQQ-binding-like beta-propeller repeat protein [Saprospiraceae bacterium]
MALGKGQMPAHATLSEDEKKAIIAFLRDEGHEDKLEIEKMQSSFPAEIPFIATGHNEFKDPEGFPANEPPWGMLTSINLDEGKIEWQVPLGTYPELEKRGIPSTGTFNMGGPIITKSGLIFIGASMDERFHVYNAANGQLLWEYQLDAGGYATPATFMIDGKQYVVIAGGGGGKPGTKAGDKYYCFALGDQR